MRVSDFDFELPEDLIALRPAAKRDFSRLLFVNPEKDDFEDLIFHDLPKLLQKGDCLVFNNSRTIHAQLDGVRKKRDEKSPDVNINVNLHKNNAPDEWFVFIKPAKRVIIGDILYFKNDLTAEVLQKNDGGEVLLKFNKSSGYLLEEIEKQGNLPIPPYIGQKRHVDAKDENDYQTVYAKTEGSVATPTAGLHFTNELLDELKNMGIETHFLTLHVGAGTFLPVKADEITDHKMHSEYFEISKETADALNKAKKEGRRIICVGTTSMRSIESSLDENDELIAQSKETDIFLYPGKKIRFADALISNFHLPKSTLLMLMSAFSGTQKVKQAYSHAIKEKYRFFSYGDAGFWLKAK